jgi:hypothetical protein
MFVFGSGVLYGTPKGGEWSEDRIAFGIAKEVEIYVQTSHKELYGQYNFPVAIGSGNKKMTGKAKSVTIAGEALCSLLLGRAVLHFTAILYAEDPITHKEFSVTLMNCVPDQSMSPLSNLERGCFTIPEFTFGCFSSESGQVCKFRFGDAK